MKAIGRFPIRAAVLVLLAGVLPVFGANDRGGKRTEDLSLFSAEEYLSHVAYLASNELEGRGTGQKGNDEAAEYIASVFRENGVQPAGDDGTYFQNFALKLKSRIGEATSLAVGTKGRPNRQRLTLQADYVPFPFSEARSFAGDVVFAGFGIANTDLDYNDYAGLEATGKVLLILRGMPQFARFDPDADESFRSKASKANAREAVAVLVVNSLSHPGETGGAARDGDHSDDGLYDFEQSSPGMFGFGRQDYGIPMLHITRAAAGRMLRAAGMPDLDTLEGRIESTRKPVSAPLKGVSVKGTVAIEPVETPVRNVVGLIRGTGPKADEMIVLGAHYDHIGVVNKGQPNFDPARDINNGADDNASGSSMLMTMAKAFTRGPAPNRSILFVAFTGEELGLLGSQHFVDHPTVDLDKCITMLNFDMVGRLKDDRVEIGGLRTGGFEEMVQRHAETYSLKIKDGGGGSGPSDHNGFYSKNIPVMFFFTGLHRQYHEPTDDTELINSQGAARIARLAADCIDEIDARPERPQFTADARGFTLDVQDGENGDGHEGGHGEHDQMGSRRGRGRLRLGLMLKPGADSGAVVERVIKDSPADKAGIKDNDRIVKVGGSSIKTGRDLFSSLRGLGKSGKAQVVVERDGASVTVEVQLGEPGKPAEPEQPFGEPGKALIALAQRFQDASDKGREKRAVSWKADAESITITMRLDNRARIADFLEQAADVMDQFPKDEKLTVTFAGKAEFSSEKGLTTEFSVTLKKRQAAPDAGEKDSPSGDAAKSKDDTGEKAKTPDKPKQERRPRSGRHRQAA
jgi:hypothetical protein